MLIASVLAATPAWAQTPEVPSRAPHAKVVSKTVVSKPAARKVKPHHTVPIVAPRHGVTPRKPGHKAARLITQAAPPKPGAAKGGPAKAAVRPAGPAKPAIPADQGTVTGLHLPRYASLKTDDVNMRSGPGSRYPVLWTYKRRELPVRIEREFDVWRLVEDMDGIRGWVHQATLTGRRTFVITGTAPRTLRAEGADTAAAVAVLKPGVVGRVRGCAAGAPWCEVQVGEYRGWLARADFWGTDAGETVIP
jgi:SH3-like domain-containing protein